MRTLHVLNGDSTRFSLERSDIPGVLTVWADVLHDGPVPNVPASELRRIRAQYHETYHREPVDEGSPDTDAWDAALDRYGDYDELVFWFEHDLFDQLILIRHLHWLSQISHGQTRFSLICIGEYPGRPRFAGLGELAPSELAGTAAAAAADHGGTDRARNQGVGPVSRAGPDATSRMDESPGSVDSPVPERRATSSYGRLSRTREWVIEK